MSPVLEGLDNAVFMFREHLGKAVGIFYLLGCLRAQMSWVHVAFKEFRSRLDARTHT